MEKVGIVIVTFNRLKLLKEEIESIRQQSYKNYSIVVVNNGSTDGTETWLQQQSDIITITQENLGCTGGMYTGIKYVTENGFDLCWVMDDDVEYKNNSLEELVNSYHLTHGKVGFLCSRVEGIDGQAMNVPNVDIRPLANGYCNYYDMVEYQMIKVYAATFVSLMFSCDVVKKVGLPIKEFFIWGDDSEFTMRISRLFDCYLCCKSVAIHKRTIQGALSFKTEKDTKRLANYFYRFRNTAYIIRHFEGNKAYWANYFSLIKTFMECLLRLQKSKAVVILKVLVESPFFNPIVKFPNLR